MNLRVFWGQKWSNRSNKYTGIHLYIMLDRYLIYQNGGRNPRLRPKWLPIVHNFRKSIISFRPPFWCSRLDPDQKLNVWLKPTNVPNYMLVEYSGRFVYHNTLVPSNYNPLQYVVHVWQMKQWYVHVIY